MKHQQQTETLMSIGMDNQGAALLTAVVVAGLASFLAVAMLVSQQLEIRRTANIINADQAYFLSKGVESWAGNLLVNDARQSEADNQAEVWAMGLVPLKVEGGKLSCRIEDMQGRFNLNNLLADNQDLQAFSRRQFQRLLALCGISNDEAAPEIYKWLALNYAPRTGQADIGFKFTSASELRLAPGMDRTGFAALAPYICALPSPTLLNINTAPAMLIASLSDDLGLTQAKAVIDARPATGYKSLSSFLAGREVAGHGLQGQFLTVASRYFMVQSRVNIGRGRIRLRSIIQRSVAGYQVLSRSLGP